MYIDVSLICLKRGLNFENKLCHCHCHNTRSSLLQDSYILIDENRIALYGDNPFLGANREDTKRVLIKDLPVWASDGLIKDYIKTQSQLKTNGTVYRPKARNNITSASSPFFNRDRYFYAQRVIDPPLPNKIKFGDQMCRIMYCSKHVFCKRCHKNDHKSTDFGKCDAYIASQPDLLSFTRGTFSILDRCDVTMDGHTFPTSEHCYQCSAAIEAIRKDVTEAIIKAKNPWDAKRLGASIKSQILNWKYMKYDVLHNVLIAKACTSEHFKDELLATYR